MRKEEIKTTHLLHIKKNMSTLANNYRKPLILKDNETRFCNYRRPVEGEVALPS